MSQFLLFSLCATMPALCLPAPLPLSSCRCLLSSALTGCCIAASASPHATGQTITWILWICLSNQADWWQGGKCVWWHFYYYHAGAAKTGRADNLSNPAATQAPHAPWDVCWEKGRTSRVGVLTKLEDGWWGRQCLQWKWVFWHCACCYTQVLGIKKPKSKIKRCSGIGKFCPPAAALPEWCEGKSSSHFVAWS